MAQGLVTAARLTGEAQKLAAVVIGRPSEEEVNQGANISCAQRQGGCWANWPQPRSREEIFFLPCVLWVRRTTPRKEIGEGWVIIASCLHAGNPPPCLAMSVKMAKINPLSGGKNIIVILKLNIPETEGAATQLNTEQDNLESLEDGRWYLELLGVGLSFKYQFPNQPNNKY